MVRMAWLGMLMVALTSVSYGQGPVGGGGVPQNGGQIPIAAPQGSVQVRNLTDPLASSFVAAPNGSFLNSTDPLAVVGTPVVVGAAVASNDSLGQQSGGRTTSGPFLNPTEYLGPSGVGLQAGGGTKSVPLIQIKVRVVDVSRTDSFQAASALDYVASNGGPASLITGNNVNGNVSNTTGATRFPALVGGGTNPLLGLNAAGTALGAPGSGMLVNLTGKHLNWIASILATDMNGDIVTAPQVTTLNGQNVEFVSGKQQPFQLGQSIVGPDNSSVQNFFYKHVGSYISVTPTIVKDDNQKDTDEIELKVVVRLSQTGQTSVSQPNGNGGFNLSTIPTEDGVRAISNIVRVQSGFGLVMGGLIGESEIETVSKVPILGDVPWAGALFRSKQTGRQKIETLIFIEAQVLNSDSSVAWAQTMDDFHLGQEYVNSNDMFDTNLECGLFRAGIGNYLPPLKANEDCYWERLDRTIRRQATHLDDLTK